MNRREHFHQLREQIHQVELDHQSKERDKNAQQQRLAAKSAQEEEQRRQRAEQDQISLQALKDSNIETLLNNLQILRERAELPALSLTYFPPTKNASEWQLNFLSRQHCETWVMSFKYQQPQGSVILFASWEDRKGLNNDPLRGFAIEAYPDRRIIIRGASSRTLREADWQGNEDAQNDAIENAYGNPMIQESGKRDKWPAWPWGSPKVEHGPKHEGKVKGAS